jgi:hypothetical protein
MTLNTSGFLFGSGLNDGGFPPKGDQANHNGKLGDNTIVHRSSPVQTIARGNNWKQVSCGFGHTAGIKSDGTLWLWGYEPLIKRTTTGKLGDNTVVGKSSPVQTITRGNNWKQVSAGYAHTAAIKTDGTLWLWGDNGYGQLGVVNTLTFSRSSPVQTVTFGTNWKQVSASGGAHTAAIKTDGTLWCWGINFDGQLGDNTNGYKNSPVQTTALGTNWNQVSCGGLHTAAIKTDGTLWCWGENPYGQLGDNTRTNRSSPVQTIAFGTNWKQVSCGHRHTAAIKTDGTLWCWGNNDHGQLGTGKPGLQPKSSPVQTTTYGTNWKQVSCGWSHTAAIKAGQLFCWGTNTFGQFGNNKFGNDFQKKGNLNPIRAFGTKKGFISVDAGYEVTMAITVV